MSVEHSVFKGNDMIGLKKDETDKYPFSFGRKKAQLIVENYEAIKKFAEAEPDSKKNKTNEEK